MGSYLEVRHLAEAAADPDSFDMSVQRLLHLLRVHLGMETAWTSEFVGGNQVFRFVDVADGRTGPVVGGQLPLSTAYCQSVLAGSMPSVIPDSRRSPVAGLLPATFDLSIGSYIGVPLTSATGAITGMLCATSSGMTPGLDERDLVTARLIAELIDDLHRQAMGAAATQRARADLAREVSALCLGEGRRTVLQPIVNTRTGAAFAAEGLSRFPADGRTPAEWFAAAESVGLLRDLELAAATASIDFLDGFDPPPAVAFNLSPELIAAGELDTLLKDVDPMRVIVELTEHAPVKSYELLHSALDGHRSRGLRLAVDDAGAGYASMTHVLRLRPDLLKIDLSLVRDIDTDTVRQALVGALVMFSTDTGASVIAEGVETADELATVMALGIPYVQGYVYGEPTEHPRWSGYAV